VSDSSIGTRRTYDNRARQEKAAQTRQRIIAAGSQLVHEYDSWSWRDLTFRAVAERAGVGERTVYRHFPTERHLHDAVMARLESEAGVSYEDVDLTNLAETTARVFAALQRFSGREWVPTLHDSAFVSSGPASREAECAPRFREHPHTGRNRNGGRWRGLLDVLWSPASYERAGRCVGLDGATPRARSNG
jgi:AcrR family transcriptional regulator